ncbi:L-aspartate oxidase [Ruegeria sp. ANG-S4]|uniref:L-aspartate oxidase n=1 Tax=Ruegeria sp. ANG-S4 TaxID=1577904 RepID=UPI00057EA22E|nr:L-aspartate oxidase [Ruegeria sp. ANG-S4]KIC45615.1 L-aspartate oxidase [Ruegeria sp. ANG-S4]
MQAVTTPRVVIIGAGLAALYTALKLAPRPVVILSPEPLGFGASSAWAQGGVAAAIDPTDSAEAHADDTIRAGAGSVLRDVAEFVTRAAPDHVLDLSGLGTGFDRTANGDFVQSREAAHSAARVVRVKGDQAGAEIMRALIAAVRRTPAIQVIERAQAIGLQSDGARVTGVFLAPSDALEAQPLLLQGSAYVLATGGSAGLFSLTTNPARIKGEGIGMAARAGAQIADAEFVQFHPTAIDVGEDPAPLATEALRGEGAFLVNGLGHPFMQPLHPDADLAPRDVVARAVYLETQSGRRPALDTRAAIGADIATQFPAVTKACRRNGIDPVSQPIPIAAAAHYHMGGVATDMAGRSSLRGLWACGEVASTGLHGANRLASNGLLEALVFAHATAQDISAEVPQGDAPALSLNFPQSKHDEDPARAGVLRDTMTRFVGVVRDGAGLRRALTIIDELEAENKGSETFLNMTATATLIAAAALAREESRGAHYRSDFPHSAPGVGKRSMMTLKEALTIRDKTSMEAI